MPKLITIGLEVSAKLSLRTRQTQLRPRTNCREKKSMDAHAALTSVVLEWIRKAAVPVALAVFAVLVAVAVFAEAAMPKVKLTILRKLWKKRRQAHSSAST